MKRVSALGDATTAGPAQRLDALTGLRYLAAAAVVAFHVVPEVLTDDGSWLMRLVTRGFVSVELFFVLSGFILAHGYLNRGDAVRLSGRRAVTSFWWNRFARLYPVYLLGLLLAAVPFITEVVSYSPSQWAVFRDLVKTGAANLLLVQSYSPHWALTWNQPGWSLSVEATFYLLFPLLGLRVRHLAHTAPLPTFAGLWALALILPLSYLALAPDGVADTSYRSNLPHLSILKFHPLGHLAAFLSGIALATRPLKATTPYLAPAAALAIFGVLLIPQVPYVLLHNGLLIPLYCALILGLARGGNWLARGLSVPRLVLLGEASYALYIVHFPLWVGLRHGLLHFGWRPHGPHGWLVLAAYAILTQAVAWVTWRQVELPCRAWLLSRTPWTMQRREFRLEPAARQGAES